MSRKDIVAKLVLGMQSHMDLHNTLSKMADDGEPTGEQMEMVQQHIHLLNPELQKQIQQRLDENRHSDADMLEEFSENIYNNQPKKKGEEGYLGIY